MELKGRNILITGGSSGLGLGLAEALHGLGNRIVVTGRNEAALKALCERHEGMSYRLSDVSSPDEIRALAADLETSFPDIDVLINNAGIQISYDYTQAEPPELEDLRREIDTNLSGLIGMSAALLPLLRKNTPAAIVNISSGLGYVPLAIFPVYCATKAAVNSFSLSLRHQLRNTGVQVINLAPPAVESNLNHEHRSKIAQSGQAGPPMMSQADFVQAAVAALQSDEEDITVGMAETMRQGARSEPEAAFARMNAHRA